MIYTYNPDCACDWCENNGTNPRPTGYYAALGYANPHNPPPPPGKPRIVALLSWYDEPADWLRQCVHSLAMLPATHLIALDGAYQHYPDAQARSSDKQHQAIREAALDTRTPHQIHAPTEPWPTEISKRNHLFHLAERITDPDDWYFIIDADERITEAPTNTRAQLQDTVFDVAATTLTEPGWPLGTIVYPTHPKFFRAIPGLQAKANHYTYTTPDGRKLWGNAKTDQLEPRHDLTAVHVEHRTKLRHTDRARAAQQYYDTRDQLGLEHDMPATRTVLKPAA